MKTSTYFMRIILCICACVCLVMDAVSPVKQGIVWTVSHNLLDSYYPLMFMLCGKIFLERYDGKVRTFYFNGFYKILLPFLAASMVVLITKIGFSVSIGFMRDYIKGVAFGGIEENYSFLYSVIMIYILAPFFTHMMQSLSEQEKRFFFFLLIGYFTFFDIFVILDMKLAIVGYPFLNVTGYVMLGYLIDHIEWKKSEIRMILFGGLASAVISCAEAVWFDGRNWALDLYCLTRAVMCAAVFLLISKMEFRTKSAQKVIIGLGKSAYYILLLCPILLRFVI